ncbi:hypothetical protein GH714_040938 [Hevea brasiliensis]|uniref:SBP-type domain-containing protein n=1 Tax=Hevea brasiliensis TaxID=3981 RepID=A0A6A6MGP6_HEVBR|nr:hypothetical protein GH714_040938 [Hevea brasiliensis]
MHSCSYVPGGKGFVSNETFSSSDAIAKSKNALMDWDLKTTCSFGNNVVVSSQQAIENHGFRELTYQELMGKQLPDNSIGDALSGQVDGGKIITPFMVNTNAFSVEDESSSGLSSSVVDSNSRDSSFIDLKLGRFGDPADGQNSRISKGASTLSSSESSAPPKRVRLGVNSQTPHCQVHGCNKDLSSSKEYHKRHKVCEVHSKTAKVIVNGMEQRFCQQCSSATLMHELSLIAAIMCTSFDCPGFICWLNLMTVNAAVVNVLQATMSVGESLKLVFTLEGLRGYFSRTMVGRLNLGGGSFCGES